MYMLAGSKMSRYAVLLLLVFTPAALCGSLSNLFHKHKASFDQVRSSSADPGEPLFLTPYIEKGDIAQARNLSRVEPAIAGLESYSGFFTVDTFHNGNMFFWFFPAQNGKTSAPVLLWLQGGPGGSSLFSLFVETGPLSVDASGNVSLKPVTWNSDYHMLYIDNPVGTGFSFTQTSGLSTNEVEVANNLYSALTQFFTVFADYQASPFYVTGESYAGKYIPAIGYKIHVENQGQPKIKINMQGVAIGDGLVDPVNMVEAYAPLMFEVGLADENQRDYISGLASKAVQFIKNDQYIEAFMIFDMLLNGDIYPYPTYFFNITGLTDYYNFLRMSSPPEFNYYVPFVNKDSVRKSIHVGNLSYGGQSEAVEKALINDIMNSTADWLAVLMDNYKVLLYNGQLDLIVGVPLTEAYLWVLNWSKKSTYLSAPRSVWKVNGDVAGYIRQVENTFQQVVVRNAGHILPYDQPAYAKAMIDQFIEL